jgi:hypothetical protein
VEVGTDDGADERGELLRHFDSLGHRAAFIDEERGWTLDLDLVGNALISDGGQFALRLRIQLRDLGGLFRLHGRDTLVGRGLRQLRIDERLDLLVLHCPAALKRCHVVDHLLRRHGVDQRHQQRGRHMFDRAHGGGIGNLVVQDDLRLLLSALSLGKQLEGGQWAIIRRLVIKQDRLRTRPRLQTQAGVQVLEIIAGAQRSAIELPGVVLIPIRILKTHIEMRETHHGSYTRFVVSQFIEPSTKFFNQRVK